MFSLVVSNITFVFRIAVGPKPPSGAAGRDVVKSTNLGMALSHDVSQGCDLLMLTNGMCQ